MKRGRTSSSQDHVSREQTSGTDSGSLPEPTLLSAESQRVWQLAQDVLTSEGMEGEVVVNPWSGGYYVSLAVQGKERIVYLFSLKDERSNLETLRQAARDLKAVVFG
ncbi:MAG: hypothetical protein NZT92_06230 [Abditibacteriales bacterium]|nr:hypothetical protein [Abditibacteriales bacterium]MDW8364219.1 hypothetical protein [Abditibacteriales bacterium]